MTDTMTIEGQVLNNLSTLQALNELIEGAKAELENFEPPEEYMEEIVRRAINGVSYRSLADHLLERIGMEIGNIVTSDEQPRWHYDGVTPDMEENLNYMQMALLKLFRGFTDRCESRLEYFLQDYCDGYMRSKYQDRLDYAIARVDNARDQAFRSIEAEIKDRLDDMVRHRFTEQESANAEFESHANRLVRSMLNEPLIRQTVIAALQSEVAGES